MLDRVVELIEQVLPQAMELRRDLHAHPELSNQERRTAERIRAVLAEVPGLEVLPPLSETDVVAVLNGDREGPCIALRADMDALPIEETTDVAYRSTSPGVMHACGHDGHMAVVAAAAQVLAQVANDLQGKVKFIFQPDEECDGGGRVLCERGVLESPKVDAAVALHGWPSESVGTVALRAGAAMAANNPFHVTVRGQGGHGAYPHRGTDAVVASAHIITALQSIVSRTIDPLDAAVVTVGKVEAAGAVNVIPDECRLSGTLRYLRPETGQQLRERLCRVIEQTAMAHGVEAEVDVREGYPPMVNDAALVELVAAVGRDLFGPEHVLTDIPPSMGVEDFAFYAQKTPAVTFRLGVRPARQESYPSLHTSGFDFNDAALPIGIGMLCEITRRFLTGQGE